MTLNQIENEETHFQNVRVTSDERSAYCKPSAYTEFERVQTRIISFQNPNATTGEIAQFIAHKWGELCSGEKCQWERKAMGRHLNNHANTDETVHCEVSETQCVKGIHCRYRLKCRFGHSYSDKQHFIIEQQESDSQSDVSQQSEVLQNDVSDIVVNENDENVHESSDEHSSDDNDDVLNVINQRVFGVTDPKQLKKRQLKELCTQRSLQTSGKKQDLINRLIEPNPPIQKPRKKPAQKDARQVHLVCVVVCFIAFTFDAHICVI